jgi:hypothetical protein
MDSHDNTTTPTPITKPALPATTLICQFGDYCTTAADCMPGNKCYVHHSAFHSQCIPDPTTFFTTADCKANYGTQCASTDKCCDLTLAFPQVLGYHTLSVSFVEILSQCHQPTLASGLCATSGGFSSNGLSTKPTSSSSPSAKPTSSSSPYYETVCEPATFFLQAADQAFTVAILHALGQAIRNSIRYFLGLAQHQARRLSVCFAHGHTDNCTRL